MGTTAERRIQDPGYSGLAGTAEEYIRESIVDPAIYIVPGYEHTRFRMPAYGNLDREDLDAVVQMLWQQKGG